MLISGRKTFRPASPPLLNRSVLAEDRIYILQRTLDFRKFDKTLFTGLGADFRRFLFAIYEVVWSAPQHVDVVVAVSNQLLNGKPIFLTGKWRKK